ncbi:MAG: hypothetical protein IID43_01175 [Planctomycetes bacterium]|nr:hypothetical protein [Planctomycetota bacterium]
MAESDQKRADGDAASKQVGRAMMGLWGIRPGLRVWVGGHNVDARRAIEAHLSGAIRPPTGPIELGLIAPLSIDEALYFADKLRSRLAPKGRVWIVYADRPSPHHAQGVVDSSTLGTRMLEQGYADIGSLKLDDTLRTSGFQPNPRATTSFPSAPS